MGKVVEKEQDRQEKINISHSIFIPPPAQHCRRGTRKAEIFSPTITWTDVCVVWKCAGSKHLGISTHKEVWKRKMGTDKHAKRIRHIYYCMWWCWIGDKLQHNLSLPSQIPLRSRKGGQRDRTVIREQELGEGEMLLVIFCYGRHKEDKRRKA